MAVEDRLVVEPQVFAFFVLPEAYGVSGSLLALARTDRIVAVMLLVRIAMHSLRFSCAPS